MLVVVVVLQTQQLVRVVQAVVVQAVVLLAVLVRLVLLTLVAVVVADFLLDRVQAVLVVRV